MTPRPLKSTLFPYTTLFRSHHRAVGRACHLQSGCGGEGRDRKSTRLNSSHTVISYAVFCLKKKREYQYEARKPAMAAGLMDHIWTIQEVVTYTAGRQNKSGN